MRNYIIFIGLSFVYLATICSLGCQNYTAKDEKYIDRSDKVFTSHSSTFKRDSLFIIYTIYEYINLEYDIFESYHHYKVPLEKVVLNVDTILYSPDSLKMFSFVTEKIPDVQNGKPDEFYFSGSDMIGFRSSKKDIWSLYHFGQLRPTGFKNYYLIQESFYKFYFKNGSFKRDADYYWNDSINDRVLIPFAYNLDDTQFWENSIVWKKGSRVKGYYAFQTQGNVKPTDEDLLKIPPHITYPDSILNLFNQ